MGSIIKDCERIARYRRFERSRSRRAVASLWARERLTTTKIACDARRKSLHFTAAALLTRDSMRFGAFEMSYLESVIINESIADVLTAFIPRVSYQTIDRLYVQFKFEVIANGELIKVYKQLFKEGVFITNEKGLPMKGPNWSVPDFVTLNRYRTDTLDTPSHPV